MLTVHICSETGLFSHLSNHASWGLEFRKYISFQAHLFFKTFKIWCRFQKFRKKIRKCFFCDHCIWIGCVKHSLLPREYLSLVVNISTKSLKISGTTKTKFFELKLFQSDERIWQNYCRENFSSVSDHLTSWLSISFQRQVFLGI